MQIVLLVSVFVMLMAWFYWRFIRQMDHSAVPALDKIDKRWMLGLSLLYALISFINFADARQYANPWHGNKSGDQLVITLGAPTPLTAFYYSTGYSIGEYSISAMSSDHHVIPLDDIRAQLGYSPYFHWDKISFDRQTSVSSIVIDVKKGPVEMTQFALVDNNNGLVTGYQVTSNIPHDNLPDTLISTTMPKHMDNSLMSSTVFDEIFYATSAYQYLHGIEPWVWVHPQLGIYLTIPGIQMFGMSPLGWRIMPDLASILMVPLLYLFGTRLFKNRRAAIVASILIITEFMHYTMGRQASLEPFVTLFLIMEYYFLYDYVDRRTSGVCFNGTFKSLLYCAICFALAFSCKWIALYSAPAILVTLIYCEFIQNRPDWRKCVMLLVNLSLLFIALPLVIYILGYIPYALIHHNTNIVELVYQTQKAILDFHLHAQINVTHPYASRWWGWPFDLMPLSVYFWQDSKGYMSSSVAVLGNPALCWPMWGVIAILVYQWFKDRRNLIAAFLCLAIVAQYLPYAFVQRVSFIYYFYSVTPFLILGVCYVLNQLWLSGNKINIIFAYSYLLLNILLFLMFFPALAGIEVPRSYTTHVLLWMKTWNF